MVVPVTVPDSKFVQSHGFLASVPAARDNASWDRNSNFQDGSDRAMNRAAKPQPESTRTSKRGSTAEKLGYGGGPKLDADDEQQYKFEKYE